MVGSGADELAFYCRYRLRYDLGGCRKRVDVQREPRIIAGACFCAYTVYYMGTFRDNYWSVKYLRIAARPSLG